LRRIAGALNSNAGWRARNIVEIFDVLGERRGRSVGDNGRHEVDGPADRTTIRSRPCDQIAALRRRQPSAGGRHVEIEQAIGVRLGPREFERLAASGRELGRNGVNLPPPARVFADVAPVDDIGKGRRLK
jgi:hypothetical protein